MKIRMYFVNIVVKALLVELLCLMIIDANGMCLYFSSLDDCYGKMIIIIIISFFVFNSFMTEAVII